MLLRVNAHRRINFAEILNSDITAGAYIEGSFKITEEVVNVDSLLIGLCQGLMHGIHLWWIN